MGYNASIYGDLKIIKGHKKAVEQITENSDLDEYYDIDIIKDSLVIQYWDKYNEEDLYKFLEEIKTHVTGTIECVGESSDHWIIKIENSTITELNGQIIYGELYHEFIKQYKLPPQLKQALKAWWTARKI